MISDTSQKAYKEDVLPTIGQRQTEVLEAIRTLGEATNSEIAVHLGFSINRVTPRCLELREAGKVVDVGKRKCSITGRLCYVWSAQPEQQAIKIDL